MSDSTFVTHSEFSAFVKSADQRFSGIDRGIAALGEKLDRVATGSAPRPTNWTAIIGAGVGLFAAILSFLALYIQPISKAIADHAAMPGHMPAMIESARQDERIKAQGETLRWLGEVVFEHVRDGHPGRVENIINLRQEADRERIKSLERSVFGDAQDAAD